MRDSVLLTAGTAVVAGVLSAVSTAPAHAQSASFAGSFTVINPSSLTLTISAERVVARGRDFVANTAFVVNPSFASAQSSFANTLVVSGLNLGVLESNASATSTSFSAVAANALSQAITGNANVIGNVEGIAAIIRAGAGVDGLD